MRVIAICILLSLTAFTGTALAAQAVDPGDPGLIEMLRPVIDAAVHGQPLLAAALAVVFLMALARKYMPAKWKEGVKGDIIGTALVFGMAFFGAIASTWAVSGAAFSVALFVGAGKVAGLAIGGYTIIHKVMGWVASTQWYQDKVPAWMKAAIAFATSLIGSNAVAKAEKAGAAAVAANPPKGMAGDEPVVEVE